MNTREYIINKFNITVANQYFIDVPQLHGGADLAKLFAELGFTKGAEIGTDEGIFAEYMLKTIPNLELICIDPWKAEAYEDGEQPEGSEDQSYFDIRFGKTQQRLENLNAVILKETSLNALDKISDDSLDFVYIDGNHDFLNVTQDIQGWLKKVRPGGILSGHDYAHYPSHKFNHVKRVVQAYCLSYHLLPVFATVQGTELKRDKFRSWFIIKP